MVKLLQKTSKLLLVAAGLGVGASAWAQTTAFSQDFTAIGESTDPADYGFTITTYNNGAATVTGGVLQYSLPANSNKDVSAWGAASFTAIPTGNVVTVSCSWNPGGPTGTRPYSTLRVYGSNGTEDKVVFSLYNEGQSKRLLLRSTTLEDENANLLASGDNWRSGSIVWNVVAVLNLNTQKVTSLIITKEGESTPAVSASAIDFENEVVNINKFEFGTNKKSNGAVTSTLDNVLITYEAAASTAAVTYKYEDTDGNDLSSIKADVVEQAEVSATVSSIISPSLTTTFYNGDESKRYVYSTYTCADETVPAGGTTVTLKFAAQDKFTYNVRAVDAESNVLGTIASVSGYAGDTKTLYWSKYVKIGDQWYNTSTTDFYKDNITASDNKDVLYAESDIAYFIECENMNAVRHDNRFTADASASYSGYYSLRITNYYPTIYTAEFPEGGVFDIAIPWSNSNDTQHTYQLKTRTSGGVVSDAITTWTTTKGSGTFTYKGLVVPAGSSVAISCDNISGNSNGRMDYLTLTAVSSVSKPITEAGWATYCSPYALDLENATNLTDAYIVTGGADGVLAKTSVKGGTVPAGTGLLLKGTEGSAVDVTIPVVANSSTNVEANQLIGKTAEYALAAKGGYVLMASPSLGFYLNSNAFTVGANTAYLPAGFDGSSARVSFFSFDDDAAGISEIENGRQKMETRFYNLNGQRVSQPSKGLYIVNGKKLIKK